MPTHCAISADKQLYHKHTAVQIDKVGEASLGEQAANTLGKLKGRASEVADKVLAGAHKPRTCRPAATGLRRTVDTNRAISPKRDGSVEIDRLSIRRRPAGWPVMYQTWAKLPFLHWRLPAEQLRPHVPAGLEIDTFDGSAWIGLTPFTLWGLRPVLVPPLP